ncbi:MAG: Peptidase [Sphingomonas bacterium]|uniref:D-Ala-D-Ala carboxypeptidase family metallohydrolase n=1 Tax=Sphingomonas bacterium TaxID=1895847 RepID=UPI00263544B2|nr:D-Ala-D-Ala carboxypeptidase family metallohydrolase [Sphingomonas bacterium]MDB5695775.1 Peptidase [Sphingomonas bacterium]
MTRLSRHFTLAEMIASDAARALDIANLPTAAHLANLRTTALGMEQVRAVLGNRPITIESAYRARRVNEAVGGVPNSAHAQGLAVDFTVAGLSASAAARMLQASWLVFDQLILEVSRGVCHISFAPELRREVLTQAGGAGTVTSKGLPRETRKA